MSSDPNNPDPHRPREPSPGARPTAPKRVQPASSAGAKPSADKPVRPVARPARPQAPTRPATGQRLEGVLEASQEQVQSIEAIVPSGLSTSTYLPSARRNPELERQFQLKRQYQFRQTITPTALVLSVSTLAMAGGWFLLDPTSALRNNPLGTTIPITLLVFSVVFCIVSTLLVMQISSLRKRIESLPRANDPASGV